MYVIKIKLYLKKVLGLVPHRYFEILLQAKK